MAEYVLSVNKYKQPVVLDSTDARGINLLRLLILSPGKNHLFPLMGCNMIYYRYILESKLPDLSALISAQINQYYPDALFDSVEFDTSDDKNLKIIIICKDVAYSYGEDELGFAINIIDKTTII